MKELNKQAKVNRWWIQILTKYTAVGRKRKERVLSLTLTVMNQHSFPALDGKLWGKFCLYRNAQFIVPYNLGREEIYL